MAQRRHAAEALVRARVEQPDAYLAQAAAIERDAIEAHRAQHGQRQQQLRKTEATHLDDSIAREAAQEEMLHMQKQQRREAQQAVAQAQLAQMRDRQAAAQAERAAERAAARGGDDGTAWQARFGRSLA